VHKMLRIVVSGLIVTVLALGFFVSTNAAVSGPFEDGYAANRSGDYAAALKIWRPLAEEGNVFAQNALGMMYNNGKGVPQDRTEAMRWYRLAAYQGDANSQFNLGDMYYKGQDVAQNYTEAMKWYRLAAYQGDANAQFAIGGMYLNAEGARRDYVRAYMWFNLSAANHNERAVNSRDSVESLLSPTGIKKAQELTRICKDSKYTKCD